MKHASASTPLAWRTTNASQPMCQVRKPDLRSRMLQPRYTITIRDLRILRSLMRIANYSDTSTSWYDTATVASIGSPRPNVGEGLEVRGIPLFCPETRLWMRISDTCERLLLCARPLTPNPSPTLGRGEPTSVEFFERASMSSLYSVILNNDR